MEDKQPRTYILVGSITAQQPLATCSKDLADREGRKNEPLPVPSTTINGVKRLYFPGTGLRGAIRRAARDVVHQSLVALTGEEKPWGLDEHYMHSLGGIKGEGEQDRASVALEASWRQRDPLLSLFGAGSAGVLGFVSGHVSIGNAICRDVSEPVIFSGARTDEFYRNKALVKFLSDADIENLVRQSRGGKDRSALQADIKKLDTEIKAAVRAGKAEQVTELESRRTAAKEQLANVLETSGTSDVSVAMPLAGWQAIPQGAVMDHRMHVMLSNPVELGLLLKGLGQLAQRPFVGAHYATGCGMISGEWEVFVGSSTGKQTLGTVTMEPFEPLQLGDPLASAIGAFDEFMAARDWDFGIPVVK